MTDYSNPEKASVKVLKECVELQLSKSKDYQNAVSSVKQADYYRLGIDSIYDMMHTKMLRLKSLLETAKAEPEATPKFESIRDTAKDLINYTSFFAAWLDGGIEGQDTSLDMFNRVKKPINTYTGTGLSSTTPIDRRVLLVEDQDGHVHPQLRSMHQNELMRQELRQSAEKDTE